MVDSMREGETIRVRVAVVDVDGDEVDVPEELSVTLTPAGDADEQDYRLSMHPVAIASGGKSATVELTAAEDQDLGVDDMETLMLDAVVAGKGRWQEPRQRDPHEHGCAVAGHRRHHEEAGRGGVRHGVP